MLVCKVCRSERLAEINESLARGESERRVAECFEVSASSVHRHKVKCIPALMVKAERKHERKRLRAVEPEAKRQERVERDLLMEVDRLILSTDAILSAATEAGDHQTALKAIDTARRNLELLGRLTGALDLSARVRLQFESLPVKELTDEELEAIVDGVPLEQALTPARRAALKARVR